MSLLRLTKQQRRFRLVVVFLFTLGLTFTFYVYQTFTRPAGGPNDADDMRFIGLRHAKPEEVTAVLPESARQPVLLSFGSKMCYDCRRMAPLLAALTRRHPAVVFRKVDVLADQEQAAGVIRTFKPVSVPVLVMIAPGGEIRNVLYSAQSPLQLATALKRLENDSRASSGTTGKITGKTSSGKS